MSQDLISKINAGYSGFSKGQKLIAGFIADHYERAAYMTASKLGAEVGVSESTVVRFADVLGYAGYPEMQQAVEELVRTRLTTVQRIEITNDRLGNADVLERVLTEEADRIRSTLESISKTGFENAVNAILSARNIYVIGVRSASMLASFLTHNLGLIFDNVRAVSTASGSEIFEQILRIGDGDVMIAISFPRYSKRTVNAVNYARGKGVHIISVTDSAASPIASQADELLTARSDMASFVDSLVAPMSILDALIVAIARKKRDEISETFASLEAIWDEYEVYAKEKEEPEQ